MGHSVVEIFDFLLKFLTCLLAKKVIFIFMLWVAILQDLTEHGFEMLVPWGIPKYASY